MLAWLNKVYHHHHQLPCSQKAAETNRALSKLKTSNRHLPTARRAPLTKLTLSTEYRPTGCRNCGGSFPHQGLCPAKGKQCRKCGKLNHFQSAVCRSRPIAQPSGSLAQQDSTQNYHSDATRNPIRPPEHYTTSDSDDDYIYGIHSLMTFSREMPKFSMDWKN
jgi:hypothetical protein